MEVHVFDVKPYDREYLKDSRIHWKYHEFRLSSETAPLAKGAKAIVVFVNDIVDEKCLKILKGQKIELIALRCAGYNNVDLEAAKKQNIHVTCVPVYAPHAIAEHTIALLLTLNRKIHKAYYRVRDLNFSLQGLLGFDLYKKTAGVIGGGKIGLLVADLFKGFGMHVLIHDPIKKGKGYVGLSTLFKKSDVISLHVPLTSDTHYMINENAFNKMKEGVFLINTSRGKVIETKALLNALRKGKVGGAALDVYEEEEGIFFEDLSGQILLDDELSLLLTFPNVLITSHQAFFTHEALSEISRITTENLLALKGKKPFLPNTEL